MGQFSWIDADGSQNITDKDEKVIMLIPTEHKKAISEVFDVPIENNGIEGKYNGYGSVIDKNGTKTDVLDVMTFLNVCLTSEEQFDKLHFNIGSDLGMVMLEARKAYQDGEIKSINDFKAITDQFDTKFRMIGIAIAIGDSDEKNARPPYPMKWTLDESLTYENSLLSMDEREQEQEEEEEEEELEMF